MSVCDSDILLNCNGSPTEGTETRGGSAPETGKKYK